MKRDNLKWLLQTGTMNDTHKTAKTEEDATSVILSIVMGKKTNVTVKMIVSKVGCFNSVYERRHIEDQRFTEQFTIASQNEQRFKTSR